MTRPAMNSSYCPYDIVRDVDRLSMCSRQIDTSFGSTHVVTRLSSGPTVTVLLHGIGGTWSSWTPLLQAADDDGVDLGNLVLVDLPGFGASDNLLNTLDSTTVGEMLFELARSFGFELVRLVGQSMGAFLAADMAARRPARVTHLTALAGSFRTILQVGRHPLTFAARHPAATALNVAFFASGKSGAPGRALQPLLRRLGEGPLVDRITAHPELLRPSVRSSLDGGFTARNMRYAASNARRENSLAPWSDITARASFVWGELDPLVPPSEQPSIAGLVPAARRTVVADAAHILHIERPHEVLRALAQVIDD